MGNEYELLDSGDQRKLERFGDVVLSRPCGQANWGRQKPELWGSATASFDTRRGWQTHHDTGLPSGWVVTIDGIAMRLAPTPSGQVGVFPETRSLWDWMGDTLGSRNGGGSSVLNLFAHSGGATLAAARVGASVCHVDSSKSMVTRARENAALNQLEAAPIRWIVEDVGTFLDREIRRGRTYDAIMLDPPSFGHGTKGEQYRLDRDLVSTLGQCHALLGEEPAFVLLTSHTQGVAPTQLESLMTGVLDSGTVVSGAMQLTGASDVRPVDSGVWARWIRSTCRTA
jgi:23S rRNA (cytosine1962-C5)-methyltransferase